MQKFEQNKIFSQLGKLLTQARQENHLNLLQACMRTGYKPENLMALETGDPKKWSTRTLWTVLWLFEQYDRRLIILSVQDPEDKSFF